LGGYERRLLYSRRAAKLARVALPVVLVLAFLTLSKPIKAQIATASIAGSVQDSSGAVITGARVQIKQTDTGITHTTTSGADGAFTIPPLPVGSYSIEVQFSGFAPYLQDGIVLTVGQVASVNITLKPGAANQTVTVEANAEIVETTESSSSNLVNDQVIDPMGNRFSFLLVLIPSHTAEDQSSLLRQGSSRC
jgi:hypothetical protein